MTRRPLPNPLKIRARQGRDRFAALTIVEMLVAMSISLLIMAAVVTVFANISTSVTKRRATIEMSSALRNVRETLARDLRGATCPAIPWQRPESNHGYLEIIEGPQNDYYPSPWLFDGDGDGQADPIGTNPDQRIDLALSSLPGSNLGGNVTNDFDGKGQTIGGGALLPENTPTDGRGLGDGDDTLMLTVRNEKEPFVGRIPRRTGTANTPSTSGFAGWESEEIESPLAEVVWFALENPVDPNRTFAFGEAGYRTIYRRALLILPDLEYRIPILGGGGNTVLSAPGVVRVLAASIDRTDVSQAIASLIAYQERFDLSVRLEWDPLLPGDPSAPGRWVLRANTLGDLTKRENRFEHHGYVGIAAAYGAIDRYYPFAAVSAGVFSGGSVGLAFVPDPELRAATTNPQSPAVFRSVVVPNGNQSFVVAYEPTDANVLDMARTYDVRPFVAVNNNTGSPATARAVINEDGQVVHITRGLAPLGGSRRGDDVMMTDALAFDLRVYDPGAPVYGFRSNPSASPQTPPDLLLEPSDPAWSYAFAGDIGDAAIGGPVSPYSFERQGAYVDLGYGVRSYVYTAATPPISFLARFTGVSFGPPAVTKLSGPITPRFWRDGLVRLPDLPVPMASPLTTLFATYDTWSWHYESNGLNEDRDAIAIDPQGNIITPSIPMTDEGINGLDDRDPVIADDPRLVDNLSDIATLGPDDYAERETRPPYDAPLRGLQVSLRAYERDSRQIREVRVKESFVPE